MAKRISVFYHVAMLGDAWQAVDAQITAGIAASGLSPDVFVRNECRDTDLFEFPTLDMVRRFAEDHDYYILYLHTKGVTQPIQSVADWRACMLYWNVERWRECVEKLDKGYDAVGINIIDSPIRHFQGNFWWTTTKHIRKLGPIRDVKYRPTHSNQTDRHKAEFWLLGKGASVYQPYHHRIDPYCTGNPASNYVGKSF